MHRGGDIEPDMAVDAAAFVPPAFVVRRVDRHCQHVDAAEPSLPANLITKAVVAAGMLTQKLPVQVDFRIPVHAVEVNPDAFAGVGFRHGECLPVPGTGRRQRGMAGVTAWVERAFDHVIMRQMHDPPGVVIIGEVNRVNAKAAARRRVPKRHRAHQAAPAAGILYEQRDHVRPAHLPGGVQRHVKRLIPAFMTEQIDAVQGDDGVVVHARKMQHPVRPDKRRQGRLEPSHAIPAREHVFAHSGLRPGGTGNVRADRRLSYDWAAPPPAGDGGGMGQDNWRVLPKPPAGVEKLPLTHRRCAGPHRSNIGHR